jgi:hypothetical protein
VVAGERIPHSEIFPLAAYRVEEDTAMAAVESPASEWWLEERDACCDGDEAAGFSVATTYVAEEGRCSMELAVAVGEGGIGQDTAPELADKGGAYETRGIVGRETDEDLSDGVVEQLRQRRRRHGRWPCEAEAEAKRPDHLFVIVSRLGCLCICLVLYLDRPLT